MCNIPVVKQYVRRPHLVRSETEVLNSRVLRLVPLEVMVVPMLRDTSKALVLHISKNTRLVGLIFHIVILLLFFSVYSVHTTFRLCLSFLRFLPFFPCRFFGSFLI